MNSHTNDYESLVTFAAGELAAEKVAEVEALLSNSPEARATVARWRKVRQIVQTDDSVAAPHSCIALAKKLFNDAKTSAAVSPLAALPRWWEALKRVVAELVYDSRPQAALAGVRSASGGAFQLSFAHERTEVDLGVECCSSEPSGAGRRAWQVIGQITTDADPRSLTVAIVDQSGATTCSETQTDDHGVFRAIVTGGSYVVMIRIGDQVIVLPGIELPED